MQLPGLTLGIIADDMTGANDSAIPFYKRGCSTRIIVDMEGLSDTLEPALDTGNIEPPTDAAFTWSVNTQSRHASVDIARGRVMEAATTLQQDFGVERFFKKVDSTLRGHVAHECLALMEALGYDGVVLAPAYPEQGRQTVGGYQLVRGIPLERTDVVRDPLHPIHMSYIPDILTQLEGVPAHWIAHIPLKIVTHGAAPILKALTDALTQGAKLVVVDACSVQDLDQIALATEKAQKTYNILPAGSAGLASALARFWVTQSSGEKEPSSLPLPPYPLGKPVPTVVLSGSTTALTTKQLQNLIDHYPFMGDGSQLKVFELSPQQLLACASMDELTEQILSDLSSGHSVLVTTCLSREQYDKTLHTAELNQLDPIGAQKQILKTLAKLSRTIAQTQLVHWVVCGGETSYTVCQSIGAHQLDLRAEVETAIPLTQDALGRYMVTKSGNFGDAGTLTHVVRTLKQWSNPVETSEAT